MNFLYVFFLSKGIDFENYIVTDEEKQGEELLLHSLGIPAKTVSATTRIGHFLIDIFVINVMLLVVNIIPFISISQLFIFVLFPIYYIVMEYNFQWTVGKYITDSILHCFSTNQ